MILEKDKKELKNLLTKVSNLKDSIEEIYSLVEELNSNTTVKYCYHVYKYRLATIGWSNKDSEMKMVNPKDLKKSLKEAQIEFTTFKRDLDGVL